MYEVVGQQSYNEPDFNQITLFIKDYIRKGIVRDLNFH